MKRISSIIGILTIFSFLTILTPEIKAQRATQELYQGTIVSFGSGFNTRNVTSTFTLAINSQTSEQQVQRYLGILQESGQDTLLREVNKENLGYFSVGSQVGQRINFVRESIVDGRRRIFVVFERWTQFAELRGGYRSLDYPFSVIEISIDPRTGRGEGTFIAAARIRWNTDRRTNQSQVEIENFATFPARLLGVSQRNRNTSPRNRNRTSRW
jgi:hypothetical protein